MSKSTYILVNKCSLVTTSIKLKINYLHKQTYYKITLINYKKKLTKIKQTIFTP